MTVHLKSLDLNGFLAQCDYRCLEEIVSSLDAKSMKNFLFSCKAPGIALRENYNLYPESLDKLKIKIFSNSINKLEEEDLYEWFNSACEQESLIKCKAFINSNKFSEVSKDCLGHCLVAASKHGLVDVVQGFINSKRSSEISLSDLLLSAVEARKCGYSHIAESLKEHCEKLEDPNLSAEIPSTEFLEEMLIKASKRGCLEIVKEILSNINDISKECFYEFNRDLLKDSFIQAAKYGHMDIVQIFIGETSPSTLGDALKEATKYNRLNIVKAFIESNQFSKMSGALLEKALEEALKHQHVNIIEALINSNRSNELCAYGGLGKALKKISHLIVPSSSSVDQDRSLDSFPNALDKILYKAFFRENFEGLNF